MFNVTPGKNILLNNLYIHPFYISLVFVAAVTFIRPIKPLYHPRHTIFISTGAVLNARLAASMCCSAEGPWIIAAA